MAKKYTDEFIRAVAEGRAQTTSEYVKRLARNYRPGVSRSQLRGHARKQFGERPISEIKAEKKKATPKVATGKAPKVTKQPKPKVYKPPKIEERFKTLKNGTRIVNTRSSSQVFRSLTSSIRAKGVQARVYFQVFDPTTGKNVNIYYDNIGRNKPHGITVEEFLRRVDEKFNSGDYDSYEDAMWEVLVEDSDGGTDSEMSGASVPVSISQVSMYIR